MAGITVRPVAWDHADAVSLRRAMYDDLAVVYPDATAVVESAGGFAWLEERRAGDWVDVLVADLDTVRAGHAATRGTRLTTPGGGAVEEVRSVFVLASARRSGVARALLAALADRARARGAVQLVLETGVAQPAALALYRSLGYRAIDRFDPHPPDPTSVFLALDLV